MNARLSVRRLICCLALWVGSSAVAADQARLTPRIDPFEKPAPEVRLEPPPELDENYVEEQEEAPPPVLPQLRAILHSKRNTLVNLDGTMVSLGERYGGYRVAAAGARDVVLLTGDETVVISIDQKDKTDVQRR